MKYMFVMDTDHKYGQPLNGRDGYPIHVTDKGAEIWAKTSSTPDLDVFGLTAALPYPGHIIETSLNTYQVVRLDDEDDLILRSDFGEYRIVAQEEFGWVSYGLGRMSEVPTWNLSEYVLCTCSCGATIPRHIKEHGPHTCLHCRPRC